MRNTQPIFEIFPLKNATQTRIYSTAVRVREEEETYRGYRTHGIKKEKSVVSKNITAADKKISRRPCSHGEAVRWRPLAKQLGYRL